MSKREHFEQVRYQLTQLKKTLGHTFARIKQKVNTWRCSMEQRIDRHSGKIVLLMLMVLVAGTVGVTFQRNGNDEQDQNTRKQLLDQASKISSELTKPIISGIGQQLDLLNLEHQLEQIIRKDSLNNDDSVFLLQLNKYLNKDSLFKAYPNKVSSDRVSSDRKSLTWMLPDQAYLPKDETHLTNDSTNQLK